MNRNPRLAVGAGALALLIGAFGPWVSLLGVLHVGPTSSAEVSIVVFGGAALVALAAILGRALRSASITVGVAALAEAVYALVRIEQAKSHAGEWGSLISPGWGLYLTIIAGLFLIASTWLARGHEPMTASASAGERTSTTHTRTQMTDEPIYRFSSEKQPNIGRKGRRPATFVLGYALAGVSGLFGAGVKWAADKQEREDAQDQIIAAQATEQRWVQAQRDPAFLARQKAMDARLDRALGKAEVH